MEKARVVCSKYKNIGKLKIIKVNAFVNIHKCETITFCKFLRK